MRFNFILIVILRLILNMFLWVVRVTMGLHLKPKLVPNCPSNILAEYAKCPFDPKSPFKQFATKLPSSSGTSSSGTRRWKCHFCDEEWFGSITRVNAHLLFIKGKGVEICGFLANPENLIYKVEINKLWGLPIDSVPVPTTLHHRSHMQPSQLQSFKPNHTLQMRVGGTPGSSSSAHAREGRGKRKLQSQTQSNPISNLFNMQLKDDIDDAIGKFFFANGIPFHVARSPYYKEMISMVARRGPSYVPPGETKLRTTILDKNYSKINLLMEKMKECWVKTGCNIVMDGWTDISHRPLINIMVTCTEGPYFLKVVDCSGHRKDADFQFEVLK
jgi:hypothetical protein